MSSFLCCGTRRRSGPQEDIPFTWEHFKRPDWGIADILVPQDSSIREDDYGHIVGKLSYPEGTFTIMPYLNKMSLSNFSSSLENQEVFIRPDKDDAIRAELSVPHKDYTTITMADHDTMGDVHHAMLKSPDAARHTLCFSFVLPPVGDDQAPEKAQKVIRKMLSSLQWVDRSTVCTVAESKVVGSWLHVPEQPAGAKDLPQTLTVKKMKFFTEGLWGYWSWEQPAPLNVKPEDLNENSANLTDFATGEYLAYEYDQKLHLYLVSTMPSVPVIMETVTLSGDGEKLVRQGDEFRNIEKGQPYRPKAEDVFGISAAESTEQTGEATS